MVLWLCDTQDYMFVNDMLVTFKKQLITGGPHCSFPVKDSKVAIDRQIIVKTMLEQLHAHSFAQSLNFPNKIDIYRYVLFCLRT